MKTNRSFGRSGAIRMFFFFIQDLMNSQGNYLSPEEFNEKYNIKVNFLQYSQITSAIPAYLKSYASVHTDLGYRNSVCENLNFQLSNDVTRKLKKMFCKQRFNLNFQLSNDVTLNLKKMFCKQF